MPRKSWWARLPFGVRMTAGASVILVVTGGGTIAVATLTDQDQVIVATDVGRQTADAAPAQVAPKAAAGLGEQTRPDGRPDRAPEPRDTATRDATPTDGERPAVASPERPAAAPPESPAVVAGPVVTIRTVSETRKIPYRTRHVRDRHLAHGDERVETPGILGVQTLRYRVTYVDGRATDRRLVTSEVTREPKHRIVVFGTRRDTDDHGGDDGDHGGVDDWNHGDRGDDGGGSGGGDSGGDDGGDGTDGFGDEGDEGGDEGWDQGGEPGGADDCWPGSGDCLPIGRDADCPDEAGPPTDEAGPPPGEDDGAGPWDEGWFEAGQPDPH